jgi:hypothetical protein
MSFAILLVLAALVPEPGRATPSHCRLPRQRRDANSEEEQAREDERPRA